MRDGRERERKKKETSFLPFSCSKVGRQQLCVPYKLEQRWIRFNFSEKEEEEALPFVQVTRLEENLSLFFGALFREMSQAYCQPSFVSLLAIT